MQYQTSIDKIKLKAKPQRLKHFKRPSSITTYLTYGKQPSFIEIKQENFDNFRPYQYRYSFTLGVKGESEGFLYVAEWYNGDYQNPSGKPDQVLIEYNPNKSGQKIYDHLRHTFFLKLIEIVSCDLAFDIVGARRSDVLVRTACDVMTYGKQSNNTLYIAPKQDQSGRVKVYQKDKEREGKGEAIAETLRIEITIKKDILSTRFIVGTDEHYTDKADVALLRCCEHLNAIHIKTAADATEDWKVYALEHLSAKDLSHCLGLMFKATRGKYRDLATDASYETLNIDALTLWITLWKALERWCVR